MCIRDSPEPIQAILPTFDEEETAEQEAQQENLDGLSASEVVDLSLIHI